MPPTLGSSRTGLSVRDKSRDPEIRTFGAFFRKDMLPVMNLSCQIVRYICSKLRFFVVQKNIEY